MDRKKKIGIAMLTLICVAVLWNWKLLQLNPCKTVPVDAPYMVVNSSADAGRLVIDRSGNRLYKINAEGKVEFLITDLGNGTDFYEAKQLYVDEDGSVYVLDIQKTGSWKLEMERILKYSSKGKRLEVLSEIHYGEEDLIYKNNIIRFARWQDKLIWIQITDSGFDLVSQAGIEKSYAYEDAYRFLVDFAINPVTQKLSYLTKGGEIYSEQDDGRFSLLYSVEGKEGYWIPWYMNYDREGRLYLADIGQRTIFRLEEGNELIPILQNGRIGGGEVLTGEARNLSPIYYKFDLGQGLSTSDSHGVLQVTPEGAVSYETEYELASRLKLAVIATWIGALLGAAGIAVVLWFALRYCYRNPTQYKKIIAAMLAGSFLLTALFSMLILRDWTARMTQEVTDRTATISKLAAELIPGDHVKAIDSIDDYYSEDYEIVRNSARDIFLVNEGHIKDLYCIIYRIQDGMITSMYGTEDQVGAIYPYDWPYEGSDEQKLLTEQIQMSYFGLSTNEGSFIFTNSPILDSEGNAVGILEVGTNLYDFEQQNKRMILELIISAVALVVTLILITSEVLIFQEGRKKRRDMLYRGMKRPRVPVSMLRIMVFLIFFVTNMPKGFLPIYIMRQAATEYVFGLSPAMLVSVALAVEVLFGAMFSMGGNIVLRRLGRRRTAILGSVLFMGGLSMRAVVPTVMSFIIGNAVMGAGWGLLLLLVQIIIAEGDMQEKTEGFSGYTASSLSGVNCGVVFGAFLINWMSYQMVLVVIGAISGIALLFSYLYLFDRDDTESRNADGSYEQNTGGTAGDTAPEKTMSTIRFLSSPKVLLYFICIVIPVVSAGYFLAYLYPILGEEMGISETNIGYSYLINGICIICLGGVLTRVIIQRFHDKGALVLSAFLYAGAFLAYALHPNMATLLLTLVLLGISDGFGLPAQSTYYTNLEEVQQYGYDKAMGVYSLFENMSQVLGSFIFGVIYINGVAIGLIVAGAALLIAAAVFFVFGAGKGKEVERRI